MNLDLSNLFNSLQESLGTTVPAVLGAVAILLVGWIVAIIVRAGLKRGLGFLKINERLETTTGSAMNVEGIVASGAFYLILVVALIAFFNALKLEQVSGSLQSFVDKVLEYLPNLIAGGVLLLVAPVGVVVLSKKELR